MVQHHLPPQLTRFVGRDDDVQAICALLAQPEVRFVTLTGLGGMGKTRLAHRVGETLRDAYADGVWFVALASVTDPDMVLLTVARTLGLTDNTAVSMTHLLSAYLRDKRLLLILDNFEQLVQAAPSVANVLTAAPDVQALITSRARVETLDALEYVVPPLPLPDKAADSLAAIAASAAVQLFVQSVRLHDPQFQLTPANAPTVEAICRSLDGLPLALELVAQVTDDVALAAVHMQFGALPLPSAITGAIAWNYAGLDAATQRVFARLAVFQGGWTLDAAADICRVPGERRAVDDALADLVDKNLIRQEEADGEPFFTLLETIREFALQKLTEAGAAEILRQRHTAYYVALAERATPHLTRMEQQRLFAAFDKALDNLRAVLGGADVESAGRVVVALAHFWDVRGYWTEGRGWAESLIGAPLSARVEAGVLWVAGLFARRHGNNVVAQSRTERALALARELGDAPLQAYALYTLGIVAYYQRRLAAADVLLAESATLFRSVADERGLTETVWQQMWVLLDRGAYKAAETMARAELTRRRAVGDTDVILQNLYILGFIRLLLNDLAAAQELCSEALILSECTANKEIRGFILLLASMVRLFSSDTDGARVHIAACLALFVLLHFDRFIPSCLEIVAAVHGAQGRPAQAVRLFGAAGRWREQHSSPLPLAGDVIQQRVIALVRPHVDAATWDAAWAEGATLTLYEAVAEVYADGILG